MSGLVDEREDQVAGALDPPDHVLVEGPQGLLLVAPSLNSAPLHLVDPVQSSRGVHNNVVLSVVQQHRNFAQKSRNVISVAHWDVVCESIVHLAVGVDLFSVRVAGVLRGVGIQPVNVRAGDGTLVVAVVLHIDVAVYL